MGRTYRDIDDSTICQCSSLPAAETQAQIAAILEPIFQRAMPKTMTRAARQRKVSKEITVAHIAALDAPELRAFRARSVGFETIETAVEGTTRAKYRKIETPFDQARRHRWVNADQHKALEALCVSFQKAGLLPRVTMNWSQVLDGSHEGGSSDPRDRHTARFRGAIMALPIDYRDGFLSWFIAAQHEDVSIHELGAHFTSMKHKEARKSLGVFILQACARIFSNHFGFSQENCGHAEKSA